MITGFFGSAAPINCFIVALTLRTVSQDETARLEVNPIATREIGAEGTAPPKVGQLAIRTILYVQAFGRALMLERLALPGLDAAAVALRRSRRQSAPTSRLYFFGQPLLTLRAATAEFVVPPIRIVRRCADLRPALAHAADATRSSSCPHGMSKLAKAVRAG